VRQLTGSDHLWFALETDAAPMHFVGAAVYDPSTRPGGAPGLADLRRVVEKELPRLPLRTRLLNVPWRTDLPYWVDDADFDLAHHVRELTLRPPGDRGAFLHAITDLLEAPFDPSRPLWEMCLVRDLDGVGDFPPGCFAVMVRVHHGQFDGTTALRLMNSLHEERAEAAGGPPPAWAPERTPSAPELLLRAPWHAAGRTWRAAAAAGSMAPALLRRAGRSAGRGTGRESGSRDGGGRDGGGRGRGPAGPRPAVPHTRFSSRLASDRRVFDFLHLPLDEVREIRTAVDGATVNDVASTIAAGALRRYLASVGELPGEPLVVMMPVSAHDPGSEREAGNRISLMTATAHTEIADPLERLRAGRAASARSKRATTEVGAGRVADLVDALPTNLLDLVAEPLLRSGIPDALPMPFSGVALTNVPGPPEPLHFDGARMVTLLGATFLYDFVGLIIAITSYCDQLLVAFTSTPEAVPDPGALADCFREAYHELREAAEAGPRP
jgi:WS/DGAT/MGAT family acyltransferase